MNNNPQIFEQIEDYLAEKQDDKLQKIASELDNEELADVINSLSRGKKKFFRMIEPHKAGEVLFLLNRFSLNTILKNISRKRLGELFGHLSSDDEADLVELMPEDRTHEALQEVPAKDKEEVHELLQYEEDTAGALMQKELLSVNENATVKEAIDNIHSLAKEGEDKIHNLFLVDQNNKLSGVVSLRRLLLVEADSKVSLLKKPELISVSTDTDQEEVANIFKQYDLVSLPVVDSQNKLVGRIMVDDIMDVVSEENTEDMYMMAGVDKEDHVLNPIRVSIKKRLPWLVLNLFTAILAASVVGFFQNTIQKFVLLAVYMPIVAGMGGNAGTQVITVIVRGLALDELKFVRVRKLLAKEMVTGLTNGIVVGVIIGFISYVFNGGAMLGVVIFLAMVINLTAAAIFGTLVPLTLKFLKLDPALASSVFVTTSTDLFGFLAFLGLATVMM